MNPVNTREYIDKGLFHTIHTSGRRSFRSCRRRWDLAYNKMYYPKVTPRPLEFGVAFHAAMEVFYNPNTWGKSPEAQVGLALTTFKNVCDIQFKNYKRLNGEPDPTVVADYKDRIQLGLNMIKYYTENVSPEWDVDFVPVEVEVEFEVPILSPQGTSIMCKCDACWKKWMNYIDPKGDPKNWEREHVAWLGLPVTYGGRLDMLARDNLGRYWIFDWKTTDRMINEGTQESFLELDDQIASYVWALRTHYNIPVAGFVYVEIKKTYPSVPEQLSRPYKGRMYSTNKQSMTTFRIFNDFVMVNDPEAYANGAYDEYLNWLKVEGPRFHQRFQIHKNDHEIEQIGRNVYLEALDMVSNPRIYPQPGRFSCPTCLYRQPCLGMNQGEDYPYMLETLFEKREKHYYEEASSTD